MEFELPETRKKTKCQNEPKSSGSDKLWHQKVRPLLFRLLLLVRRPIIPPSASFVLSHFTLLHHFLLHFRKQLTMHSTQKSNCFTSHSKPNCSPNSRSRLLLSNILLLPGQRHLLVQGCHVSGIISLSSELYTVLYLRPTTRPTCKTKKNTWALMFVSVSPCHAAALSM